MIKVLFVCMGNICRSPTAEGVFRRVIDDAGLAHLVEIDSAGTHAYHVGEPPDLRSTSTAARRGIDLSTQRARRVEKADFEVFDFVLAMDQENQSNLLNICPPEKTSKVQLFLEYAETETETEVPDPYYGGARGFDHVLDLIEAASQGLLTTIIAKDKAAT